MAPRLVVLAFGFCSCLVATAACTAPDTGSSGADITVKSDKGSKTKTGPHPPRPGDEGPIAAPPPVSPSSPRLESMDPISVGVTSGDLEISLTGVNFNASATVLIGASQLRPSATSATSLRVVVPAAQLRAPASLSVKVQNPSQNGGASNVLSLTVANSGGRVSLTQLSPSRATAGSGELPLRLSGSGFSSKLRVRFNGTDVPTTAQGSTSLSARVPATLLRLPGQVSVAVFDPQTNEISTPQAFVVDRAATSLSASCENRCVDYGYKVDQCLDDWSCNASGCLEQKTCAPACKYSCRDYDYTAGQCSEGWACKDGCLVPQTCSGQTTKTKTTSCEYACVDPDGAWSYASGECKDSYECGSDKCLHAKVCSTSTVSGASCEYPCNDTYGAWSYAPGECTAGYQCGSDGCLHAATCSTTTTTASSSTCEYPCNDPDGYWSYSTGECKNGYACGADGCLQQSECTTAATASGGSCTPCADPDGLYFYAEGDCRDGYCCIAGCVINDPSP